MPQIERAMSFPKQLRWTRIITWSVVVLVVVALAPWLPVLALIGMGGWLVWRRRAVVPVVGAVKAPEAPKP